MNQTRHFMMRAINSPACILALGLGPLVMKSYSSVTGLMMGLAFSMVFILSVISVSLIRKLLTGQSNLPMIFIITSAWVTVINILYQAWFYELSLALGVYIPLLAMNGLLLAFLQENALKNTLVVVLPSLIPIPALVIVLCVFTGTIRELLSSGVVLTDINLIAPSFEYEFPRLIPAGLNMPLFKSASGAFIVLACLLALINLLFSKDAVKIDLTGHN